MKRLFAASMLLLTLGMPAVAHAEQGPGYGGDADGLEVSWKTNENQALAAAPPPVPTDTESGASSQPAQDPERIATAADAAQLQIDGIGFRGLSEVQIQFGSAQPVAVRADQTGTITADFPATGAADPGTTVVAIGRGPSGATRTLVGSIPPLPHGTNLMGLVPWVLVVPVVLLAVAGMIGRRPRRVREYEVPSLLLAPAPTGPMIAAYPMPAPTTAPIALVHG
ncbi:MAG: hypothetical protein MUF33_03370 [Candidatus Nanopelagicales bacterium]|nr:hypothetical protein [Candidatus Nanopelagicales bacterium]MCU0297545.1 hypothetical protein [Candidatus Nanopelagicales bacterium]